MRWAKRERTYAGVVIGVDELFAIARAVTEIMGPEAHTRLEAQGRHYDLQVSSQDELRELARSSDSRFTSATLTVASQEGEFKVLIATGEGLGLGYLVFPYWRRWRTDLIVRHIDPAKADEVWKVGAGKVGSKSLGRFGQVLWVLVMYVGFPASLAVWMSVGLGQLFTGHPPNGYPGGTLQNPLTGELLSPFWNTLASAVFYGVGSLLLTARLVSTVTVPSALRPFEHEQPKWTPSDVAVRRWTVISGVLGLAGIIVSIALGAIPYVLN